MQYTRRELLDLVLDFAGENRDPAARNTAERLINIAIENIWSKMAWQQFQMPVPFTFMTVPGVPSYPLPVYFGRVRGGIIRNVTNGAKIYPSTLDSIQENDPGLSMQGTPQVYAIGGTVGVDTQVVPAGEDLLVVSSSPNDLSVRVSIAGINLQQRHDRLQVLLNGTFPQQAGTWKKVIEVGKALTAGTEPTTELTSSVGIVTLSGHITGPLVYLRPYESAIERFELTLWPTPMVACEVAVPFLRSPHKLLYDADVTPMGWGPAILEEMDALWKINTGESSQRSPFVGPALLDLIALENSNRFHIPARVRPFLG
jgi:hypothetical protein